jgi:hypothetical protein
VAEAETDDQDEVAEEVAEEPADEDHLAPVLATLALAPSVPFDAQEATAGLTNGNGNGHASGNGNGHAGGLAARLHGLAAAARNTNGDRPVEKAPEQEHVLGGAATPAATPAAGNGMARTPASMDEDETPIFRSLRSNWLSTDSGERPWANSEVDAGWDAADRVEATPPTRRTETGLPMRRPGNRLIPGGLSTPAPVQTVRDPEAIRARLAAHAAGVSRGRNAASVPDTTTQEADPA